MGKELRSKERLATEEFLTANGVPTLGYISAPERWKAATFSGLTKRPWRSDAVTELMMKESDSLKELTKDFIDEYIVVPMPHGDGEETCLHLMSIISFVDTDKAVVYSKYMPVFFREYLINRGIQLIECNDEEYDYLGTNLLALEPGKCILIEGCPDIQKENRGCWCYRIYI